MTPFCGDLWDPFCDVIIKVPFRLSHLLLTPAKALPPPVATNHLAVVAQSPYRELLVLSEHRKNYIFSTLPHRQKDHYLDVGTLQLLCTSTMLNSFIATSDIYTHLPIPIVCQ